MPPTLVHIGDIHTAPGPGNADRYRALDQIIDEGVRRPQLGAWLIPGDLSHARQAIEDKNALADRVVRMAAVAPVLILYGNHDLPGDLNVFAYLKAPHPIYVIATPHCLRIRLATGQFATVFCLPYPTRAGLVAQGVAPGDLSAAAAAALDAIFIDAAATLEAARADGDLTWMIGHVTVAGSLIATGQPVIGRELEITPAQLDRLGPIYKGLNHIHKQQEIHGAHYAGSICRLTWGEIDNKSYTCIELREDGWHATLHPIDVAPMFHVEGTLTRAGFVLDGRADVLPSAWAHCDVRVRYRYRQSEKAVLDESLVRKPFLQARRLKVEPIAVPDRAVRAPAVADAVTLADKVAAWGTVSGVATPTSLLDKLARLEHTDPTQLLAAMADALADVETARTAGELVGA